VLVRLNHVARFIVRDHFPRSVHAQLAAARSQRRLVPRAADFERLLFVASFRGAKHALVAIRLRIENRECAKPIWFAQLTMNAWHGITLQPNMRPRPATFLGVHLRGKSGLCEGVIGIVSSNLTPSALLIMNGIS
jgi:hypothetical protein